jgi:hypothetical protein
MRDNPLIQEFLQEFVQEARITERRAVVRLAVETKFGKESAAKCDAPLATITDLDRLRALLRRAMTAEKFSQVQRALRDAAR